MPLLILLQFQDQAFWVRRNDIDVLVLPVRFLDEIRNYTREQLSGIEALAFVSMDHIDTQTYSLSSYCRTFSGNLLGSIFLSNQICTSVSFATI